MHTHTHRAWAPEGSVPEEPLTFQTWLPFPGTYPHDWLWGQSHAPPSPITKLPTSLHQQEGGSSRVNSEFWGGASGPRRCRLPLAQPSIKGICALAIRPTWGWGQGQLQTQPHSESGTNAPVCTLAEVPEEARSGPKC